MIEEIIIDAATNIAKRGALSVAHEALGTVNKVLAKPYNRKVKRIREEFPEAIVMIEMVNQTIKKHLLSRELVSKVSYLNEEHNEAYKVVGKLEAPIHILVLHHGKLPIGTVTEIPQESRGDFKSEIAYKGKHFVNIFYKVYSDGFATGYTFDDDRLKFRWLNKAETKFEVLYNEKVILRKDCRELIITLPENEEKCMLLAMAFLAAESPRTKVVPKGV